MIAAAVEVSPPTVERVRKPFAQVLPAGLKAGMSAGMFDAEEVGSKVEPHAQRHGVF